MIHPSVINTAYPEEGLHQLTSGGKADYILNWTPIRYRGRQWFTPSLSGTLSDAARCKSGECTTTPSEWIDLRMNRQYKDLEMETEMLNSSFDATKSTCFQSTNENNGTDLTVPELLPVFFFFLVNDHLVALRTHILWSKQPLYQDWLSTSVFRCVFKKK